MNAPERQPEPHEHYNSEFYDRTVDHERWFVNGMTADEVYEAESAFALRAAGVQFEDGEGILDLACGSGRHALCMEKMLGEKVLILGVDKADKLIKTANQRIDREKTEVRDRVRFCVADIRELPVPERLPEKPFKPKLVTILGSSFGYLHKPDERKTALRNFRARLAAGGKLVIQFRETDPKLSPQQREYTERMKARKEFKSMRWEDELKHGKICTVIHDDAAGDASYFYEVDCPVPDPEHSEWYSPKARDPKKPDEPLRFVDPDGIEYSSFSRVYIDNAEQEHDLNPTIVDSFMTVGSFEKAKGILEEAGFTDVQLHINEQRMGKKMNCAIVATNPA